jgi:hypothetical protein
LIQTQTIEANSLVYVDALFKSFCIIASDVQALYCLVLACYLLHFFQQACATGFRIHAPKMVQLTEAVIRAKTRVHDLGDVKNLNLWGQGITGLMLKAIKKLGYRQQQKNQNQSIL